MAFLAALMLAISLILKLIGVSKGAVDWQLFMIAGLFALSLELVPWGRVAAGWRRG